MSFKKEIDKIKGVGTDHGKYASDLYWSIVEKDVEEIKEEIIKQAKEGKDGYQGIVTINFNQGKEATKYIPYTLDGIYEGYIVTKRHDNSIIILQNEIFEEKVISINEDGGYTFSLKLTTIGGPYLADIARLCKKEGIELKFYLHGTGSVKTKSGYSLKFYDKIKFNHTYKTKSSPITWEVRAEYKVV